ncbi:MAG: hypothetical protein ACTSU7_00175 [Candidatus Heimdallarchaeaceae archaeon]
METIDEETFEAAKDLKPTKKGPAKEDYSEKDVDMDELLKQMNNPVKAQQEMAVKIKMYLDLAVSEDITNKGYLTEHTRKWVESYNNILEKIQRALHGDKSVNLHLHKISHSEIATKIRESVIVVESDKKKKKNEE